MENVSIIIPVYKPKKDILQKVIKSIKEQKYQKKVELLQINLGWGLAKTINYGIKKSKYSIIVTLHQDCVPESKNWLANLVKPLEKEEVVASWSDVYDVENKKRYTPILDEKGCAYKKSALEKVSYFDEKTFLNSGEDRDMFIKLKKIGKLVSARTSVVKHFHPGYLKAKGYKKLQNANTWGTLFRIYWFKLPEWWKGLIKANLCLDIKYFYWFWRGFFLKKQDYQR